MVCKFFHKPLIAFAALMLLSLTSSAAVIDEAKDLYAAADYSGVVEKLRPVAKRSPRDANVNYYLGAALYRLGEEAEAVSFLNKAESRGLGAASELLAQIAMSHYDIESADDHLSTWEANLKKARKTAPAEFDEMASKLVTMRNMLDRVERIEIVDSVDVDSATFFQFYRLSPSAGRIIAPEVAQRLVDANVAPFSPAYMPETRNELFWSSKTDDGYSLMGAGILDDGTLDHPGTLLEDWQADNSAFPFLMSDGMTLYFAADGDESIGGYDIFMTRRSADGDFFKPQNVGMPYNSPHNDFMLAIDETSGLGWWATDRNHVSGKVTIYIYLPAEVRTNVEPGSPDIESLAKLNNIALTRVPDKDYKSLLANKLPPMRNDNESTSASRFEIALPGGKIYTSVEDFKNSSARSAMLQALGLEIELDKLMSNLSALREKFRKGDTSVRTSILEAESQEDSLRAQIKQARNKAIRLESSN